MKTPTPILILLTILCLALSAPAFAGIIFDDGPALGNGFSSLIDGPNTFPGQTISDGFVATGSGTAASFDFAMWVHSGFHPTNVSWELGTFAFGSDISSGIGTLGVDMTNTLLCTAGSSFNGGICGGGSSDVYDVNVTGLSGAFSAGGTYWLTLGGGKDSSGSTFVGWDDNNGPADCQFAIRGVPKGGCGVAGESFTLSSGGTTPEPSSIMLFGSGILGLAGVLRRRLSL